MKAFVLDVRGLDQETQSRIRTELCGYGFIGTYEYLYIRRFADSIRGVITLVDGTSSPYVHPSYPVCVTPEQLLEMTGHGV